ncbi:hypothetical protein BDA99DRAFT_513479 [Phascolomyces articulosus]|uniref:Uncharacterized protein n=1 Tax=Phascolomyces articulosus TaxID=60185 RepID=A0AAD5K7D4_9FUNG|nr:hypothetical protein BDA99DRAFT_513476 [Phascolomyces articulosus]KAI9259523.1 hypothetical protein BDA99DRAFT_513479 [Phascolomyces articulosus]
MGSAIRADMAVDLLQDKEFTVNGPVNGVEYVQSIRLLRDYSKHYASLPWSFESKRFGVVGGFRCCHPLEHYRMQSRLNAKRTSLEDLISLLLRIMCHRTYSRQNQAIILEYLLKSIDVQCAIKNSKVASHTISTISTALRARSSTKQGIKTIVCIFEK